ncbi:hypothetical protein [Spiroplasma endosymbiont of Aspidapion aeneum]|uniref:hypothetical protein n=1 Tax=Spiroplasma endosymbiont of Aspidapion aeneum TaxID=3066276 RepID=UPI00313ABC5D
MVLIDYDFLLILGLEVLFLFIIELINTIKIRTHTVLQINASNNNVSTTQLKKWIDLLKVEFNIQEWVVEYRESNKYKNCLNCVDKKAKKIIIPKWEFISVGYEIDYLFATLYASSKIINKDKFFLRMNFIANYLILILKICLILSLIIHIVFHYFITNQDSSFYQEHHLLFENYANWYINQTIGVGLFIMIIVIIYCIDKYCKNAFENLYERDIYDFVKKECIGYDYDFYVARQYSRMHKIWLISLNKFSKKTDSLKYMGPWTFF